LYFCHYLLQNTMHVVVCGGGIIGASVAYYLAKHGVRSTVVERSSPACAASGKAGGFLARDWCDSGDLGPLARLGFDLHFELAQLFTDCDYRRLETFSVKVGEGTCSFSFFAYVAATHFVQHARYRG
jgi:glycine/D-amino acid oxidase-like deaminating enzyme